jgi:hypothetical protein
MVVRTLAFVIVRRVLGLVGLGSAPDAKDIEIAVLRHQLMVLRRQVTRPRYMPQDRLVLAMLARLLPRERWAAFLVRPATLLRWHRELGPADGRIRSPDLAAAASIREPSSWCCGWPGRTRDGDTSGWWGSAASSASWCPLPQCGASCAGTGSAPPRAVAARAGRSSCAGRPPACWCAISSPWRREWHPSGSTSSNGRHRAPDSRRWSAACSR